MTTLEDKLFQEANETNETAEAVKAAIESVFGEEHLELRSVLSANQILQLARGMVYAEHYKDKTLLSFLQHLLKLPVSKKGRGRNDMVMALQKVLEKGFASDDSDSSLRKRLLGS